MQVLELQCSTEDKDDVLAKLWEHETLGVTEIDEPGGRWILRAFFAEAFDVTEEFAAYQPQWNEQEEIDWQQRTEDAWPGFTVGEKLYIAPPWNTEPTPAGRHRLVINPGVAFGTGADTTTQLALEALERTLQPGDNVFDFGAGSGVLALAAKVLGAGHVHGCDIDHEAMVAARQDLPEEIGLFTGSLYSVKESWADLVFANVNAETVVQYAPAIRKVLRPGGRVIAGGIPPRHAERAIRALAAQGLNVQEKVDRDIWVCIVCA